jgi:hypothetical protein
MWSGTWVPTFQRNELSDDGGNKFLWNVSTNLWGYMFSYRGRRLYSWSQPSEEAKVIFYSFLLDFLKLSKLRLLAFLVWVACRVRWVWSIGGMTLTGETEVLGEKHYTALVVDVWMSVEHWWNDTDRRKLKYWEKNLFQCLFAQQKCHIH